MSHNRVRLVFGRKGTGKSYWIKRQLDKLGRHSPLLVWDPNREYSGPAGKDPIRDALVFTRWRAFLEAQAKQKGYLGRVVIQESYEAFAPFCSYALDCGGMTVVLDELHMFVTSSSCPKPFKDLFYIGRHRRLDVYAAAWRPVGMPPFVRGCGDEIRAFQTTEPLDLQWYTLTCGENFAAQLPKLPLRRSCVWTPGSSASAALPDPKS